MKKVSFLTLLVLGIFCFAGIVQAELTPPINGEGDDKVVGVATADTPGDSSVVDLSGKDLDQPVDSPSSDNIVNSGEGADKVVDTAPEEMPGDNSVGWGGKDTDQPVNSPSFENDTPSGMAPGGPITE